MKARRCKKCGGILVPNGQPWLLTGNECKCRKHRKTIDYERYI